MKEATLSRRWLPIAAAVLVLVTLVTILYLRSTRQDAGAAPSAGATTAGSAPAAPAGPASPSLPVRMTPVPPPTPGTIDQTVEPVRNSSTQSAWLGEPAELDNGMVVSLVKIDSTTIEATTPGDTSGPAIIVTVRIENHAERPADVDSAVVAMSYGVKKKVATPSPVDPASPFEGTIAIGEAALGTYVFRVPDTTQDQVTVLVTHTAGSPVAKFDGAVR